MMQQLCNLVALSVLVFLTFPCQGHNKIGVLNFIFVFFVFVVVVVVVVVAQITL